MGGSNGLVLGISSIGASESLYETENLWYQAVAEIIDKMM